jgi:hypothetical protein
MVTLRKMPKELLALGLLLGGLVPAGEVRAAPMGPIIPEIQLALTMLQTSDPTKTVEQAIGEVKAALIALGSAPRRNSTAPAPFGRFVIHDRHKQRRALIALRAAASQLRVRAIFNVPARTARTHLLKAINKLQTELRKPFII